MQLRLGIALPWLGDTWPAGPTVAPSVLSALEEVDRRGLLPDHAVEWMWMDTQCDEAYAPLPAHATELYDLDIVVSPTPHPPLRPHVNCASPVTPQPQIGPACSVVAVDMLDAHFISDSIREIPTVSWSTTSPLLSNTDLYPTFSRLVPS
jgi:hypothetical protein